MPEVIERSRNSSSRVDGAGTESSRARLRVFALLIIAFVAVGARAAEGAGKPVERWYVVRMMGQNAGWMREMEDEIPSADEPATMHLRSRSELLLKVGRDTASIEVSIKSEFVETPDGRPVSMRSEQKLGAMPMVSEFTWREGAVDVVESQAGQEARKRSEVWPPQPGEGAREGAAPILTPRAAQRYAAERAREGATEITVTSLEAGNGLTPVTTTRMLDAAAGETAEAFGKVVPARAWRVTQTLMPGVESVEWINDAGDLVRGDTNLGGLTLTLLASDEATALAPITGPELMASTLVKPSRKIDRPREVKRATYVVRVKDGELPDLPSTGAQKFERMDARSGRVTVDREASSPVAADDPWVAPGESSAMIDPRDPEIVKVARAGLCPGSPAIPDGAGFEDVARQGFEARNAECLRRFVHSFITTKNLDVGFATASEVARTRTGDCTEHGVLLAAALRAALIPSRCVSGVVYVDDFGGAAGVFGFHMWAQARLGEPARWVDLDATLDDDTPFDAAHITLSVSYMSDEDRVTSLAAIAPLIGRLEIEVVEVEY